MLSVAHFARLLKRFSALVMPTLRRAAADSRVTAVRCARCVRLGQRWPDGQIKSIQKHALAGRQQKLAPRRKRQIRNDSKEIDSLNHSGILNDYNITTYYNIQGYNNSRGHSLLALDRWIQPLQPVPSKSQRPDLSIIFIGWIVFHFCFQTVAKQITGWVGQTENQWTHQDTSRQEHSHSLPSSFNSF